METKRNKLMHSNNSLNGRNLDCYRKTAHFYLDYAVRNNKNDVQAAWVHRSRTLQTYIRVQRSGCVGMWTLSNFIYLEKYLHENSL